jgi:hypothetical protein
MELRHLHDDQRAKLLRRPHLNRWTVLGSSRATCPYPLRCSGPCHDAGPGPRPGLYPDPDPYPGRPKLRGLRFCQLPDRDVRSSAGPSRRVG